MACFEFTVTLFHFFMSQRVLPLTQADVDSPPSKGCHLFYQTWFYVLFVIFTSICRDH